MELKQMKDKSCSLLTGVLIVPYGIETLQRDSVRKHKPLC